MDLRKLHQFFRLLILGLFAWPSATQAQFMFVTNNGAITITKYTGTDGTAVIPGTTNGWPVTAIGDEAFASCGNLTNVVIPDSVTVIGYDVFDSCGNLVQITIPNTVTNVGDFCLFRCTNLTAVSISTGISSIGNNFFSYCSNLANIVIPNNVNTLGEAVFENCTSLTNIVIPDSVTNLGDLEFNLCGGLTGITIGNHVVNIGQSTFEGCANLTSIILPDSVTNIGSSAFLSCSSLTNLVISSHVTTIGDYGLAACIGMTNFNIPSGVTNIANYVFLGCTNLVSITVDTNNPTYCSVSGVLFDKGQSTLIQYPEGKTGDFTIPQGVTEISSNAFLWCSRLTNLIIPGTVTNIGEASLNPCSSMAGVYFQGNPPSLGPYVFSGDNATVYYRPGTSGWEPSFGGLPAVPWNPQIQTGDGNFGPRNNQFGFNVTGTTNIPIVVESCSNLGNAWMPIQSLSLTNGSFYFSDPQSASSPVRFYRISSP